MNEHNNKFLKLLQLIFFGLGLAFLLISLPFAYYNIARFLESYLFAFLFCLELTLGSIMILMIYFLTNGKWGAVTRRILEASARTIYLMALLFIPILSGFSNIYPWADSSKFSLLEYAHKSFYFNSTFFALRSIFYFFAWMLLTYFFTRWLKQKNNKISKLSAFGLIFCGLTISFAAVDWQMSLDPRWRSTIYSLLFLIGQAFGAWVFTLICYGIFVRISKNATIIPAKAQLDLGNILLTIVMLWAYISFMQYLIIWSGNLPDEVTWFSKRMHNGWEFLMLALFAFLFAAPFLALLFRKYKLNSRLMFLLLGIILFFRILERFWMIMPSFRESFDIAFIDITLILGLFALWISQFLSNLRKNSLFAFEDPNWPKEKAFSHA